MWEPTSSSGPSYAGWHAKLQHPSSPQATTEEDLL